MICEPGTELSRIKHNAPSTTPPSANRQAQRAMPWKAQQSAIVALLQFLKNSKDAEPPPLVKWGPYYDMLILAFRYILFFVYTNCRIYEKSYMTKTSSHIVTHRHTSLPSNFGFGAIIITVPNEFERN